VAFLFCGGITMEKKKWISTKIKKLVGEGKDPKQASAIAFSMYKEKDEEAGSLDALTDKDIKEIEEELMEEENNKKKIDSVDHLDVYDDWAMSTRMDETDEGYLVGRAVITNVGVFSYVNTDGTVRRELRLPEEVFFADSLATLVGKPLTNNHPQDEVNPQNVDKYTVGAVMSPINHDEFHVSAGIVVNKADGIAAVKMGRTSLSCGYKCRLDWTPGVWMGSNYDCIQREIRYNHVSIVDKGRAGDAARLRMDTVSTSYCIHTKEDTMVENVLRTINLDGVDYKAEDAVVNALKGANDRADAIQTTLDALSTEKSTLEAERDALKEKVDSISKELVESQASKLDMTEVDNRVKARIALLTMAGKAKVEVTDSMDDKAIKIAVIKAVSSSAVLDGKDDSYIAARFDLAVESLSEKKEEDIKADKAAEEVRALNSDTAGTASNDLVGDARKRNHASYGKKPGKEE
jgi:hypothetical protein